MNPPSPSGSTPTPGRAAAPGRTYPVASPDRDDPRFTFGLVLDVAEVLEAHGYPRPDGLDMVDLQQALFRLLYVGTDR